MSEPPVTINDTRVGINDPRVNIAGEWVEMAEPRWDDVYASGDPGGCLPGMVKLRGAIFVHWPRYRGDAGCYLHNGTTDSGNPSFHSRGRAIDVWIAAGHLDVGTSIFDWCYEHRLAIGLNEVIFNRRIWRADHPERGIHAYTVNPHQDHVHIALNLDGALGRLPFFRDLHMDPTEPPTSIPDPVRTLAHEDFAMQTVLYPAQNQIHTFWIDKTGHLRHAWNAPGMAKPGTEVMKSGTETFLPDRGLSLYVDLLTLDLVCRGVVADGACGEFRWAAGSTGPWGFRVIGRV